MKYTWQLLDEMFSFCLFFFFPSCFLFLPFFFLFCLISRRIQMIWKVRVSVFISQWPKACNFLMCFFGNIMVSLTLTIILACEARPSDSGHAAKTSQANLTRVIWGRDGPALPLNNPPFFAYLGAWNRLPSYSRVY